MTNRFTEHLETLTEAQSRKDFEGSAAILKAHKDKMSKEAHAALVHSFAQHHSSENPRFDRKTYEKAAGL